MSGTDRSTKDKKMAAMLKRRGDERQRGRCPICKRVVHMRPAHVSSALYRHIVTCPSA